MDLEASQDRTDEVLERAVTAVVSGESEVAVRGGAVLVPRLSRLPEESGGSVFDAAGDVPSWDGAGAVLIT
ncbi:hypothetical protein, partial [Streptomyces sp. 8P21H-1]|uniref:hypothetical protein n=1 Tax=Streptomyces sp. 8P21H-1 TaxID=2737048 RepID=UPI00156E78D1